MEGLGERDGVLGISKVSCATWELCEGKDVFVVVGMFAGTEFALDFYTEILVFWEVEGFVREIFVDF